MISQKVIEKYGLTPSALKKYFTAKTADPNIVKLKQLIADRIREGRMRALSEYRLWAAVDQAYDTPLAQTTPTILRNIMENCDSAESVLESLRGWGFSDDKLFSTTELPDGGKKHELNVPMFYNVLVPLVKSYVTIRLAKIFNDRNLTPLLEYPPAEFTAENRLLCTILTRVVETISTNFDYSSTLQQFIMNALMYSVSIKFPIEPWYKVKHENDDGITETEMEGIRYAIPHVTRTYYDMTYPLNTLNTGLGCEFAGYWTILKWGEVAMDTSLWNRANVPHGTNWLDPSQIWYNYFKEVYPCRLEFPVAESRRKTDREAMSFRYSQNDYDSAFFLTYHFQQLVPKDWGLGDYPHPVWMRFTIGADDVVMYAEVFPYHPLDYIGYDPDANRGRNSSLALEVIPFQDITGNVFSQLLQTIKRNLMNVNFYDTNIIDEKDIESMKRRQNAQYGGLNFIGYDGLSVDREGGDIKGAIHSLNFQYADTNMILSGLNTTISLLERVLAISAQEIGASASHQQSKKEVELTNSGSSNRLAYTASFIDIGIEAWKRHLAQAVIIHMNGKEVMATIPTDIPNLAVNLQKIGFEFVEQPTIHQQTAVVKGNISKLHLVQFVARRSDATRENDSEVAKLMFQMIQSIANNPLFAQIIDPTSLLEMLEYAAKLGGADDDFRVKLNSKGNQAEQLEKEKQDIIKQVMQAVEQEVVAPTTQELSKLQQAEAGNNQQAAQAIAGLTQGINSLKQQMAQIMQAVGMAPALQPPNALDGGGSTVPQPQPPPAGAASPVVNPPPTAVPAVIQTPPVPPSAQPMSPAASTTVPHMLVKGNPQHEAIGRHYLAKAGGRKKKAREMAARDGYKF